MRPVKSQPSSSRKPASVYGRRAPSRSAATKTQRRPVSVLVVVYTDDARVLLLRRARPFDFWQSVTGSLGYGETHSDAAARELEEETGLTDEGVLEYSGVSRQFVIDPRWRSRFAPGIVENVEFEWHYRLPGELPIRLCDKEHSEYRWVPLADAADQVWSWTNRDALRPLQQTLGPPGKGLG